MATDTLPLVCDKCGSKEFELPKNPRPDDTVTCASCGASGRYADLQRQAVAAAKQYVSDFAKGLFKKR